MFKIKEVSARQILDSRGNPTIEAEVYTECGTGRASVPSGASKGKHEALELRDNEESYHGKSVNKAIRNVKNTIGPNLKGMDVREQRSIDKLMIELDGTENKEKLGANALLACSLAVAKAAANSLDLPLYQYLGGVASCVLPVPAMNVINGGEHAGNALDIQEHMIMPVGAKSFSEAIQAGSEVYQQLKKIIKKKYGIDAINVGDEGGFAPPLEDYREPFELIVEAVEETGYKNEIEIGIDSAASTFYKNGKYSISKKSYSTSELVDFYKELVDKYPLVSIEDGFAEEDWGGFRAITEKMGEKIQIVGDDLFVTNIKRLRKGVEMGACNALLLKVNQIGTLSEAVEAAHCAFRNEYGVMVSHRSGETEDPFIADLAVGLNCGQIKSGALARSERCAKYNQLLRIEEQLGKRGKYAGKNFRRVF
ncbi:MAG TPA: phosphopyruvate hydratase [Thermoplasmata archaeon]|nr:phosphopyruvate hydratase [Thermoplasmata archaeon]